MARELKFKVGDRVRYVPCKGGEHWQNITLTDFSMGSWDGDDNYDGPGSFGDDELELIERPAAEAA